MKYRRLGIGTSNLIKYLKAHLQRIFYKQFSFVNNKQFKNEKKKTAEIEKKKNVPTMF